MFNGSTQLPDYLIAGAGLMLVALLSACVWHASERRTVNALVEQRLAAERAEHARLAALADHSDDVPYNGYQSLEGGSPLTPAV